MEQKHIDLSEVEEELAGIKEPREKIERLAHCATEIMQSNPPKALKYAQLLTQLAEKIGDRFNAAKGDFYSGRACLLAVQPENGIMYLERACALFSELGESYRVFQCRDNLAVGYRLIGEHEKEWEIGRLNLAYAEETGNPDYLARAHMRLGALYARRNDFANALKYLDMTLQHAEAEHDEKRSLICYDLLASLYGNMEEYDLAFLYTQKYLDASIRTEYTRGEALGVTNMALLYAQRQDRAQSLEYLHRVQNMKNIAHLTPFVVRRWIQTYELLSEHELALQWYKSAREIVERLELREEKVYVYYYMASSYSRRGEHSEALPLFRKALELVDGKDFRSYYELLNGIATAYEQAKDFEKALEYRKKFIEVYKELFNEEKQKAIAEMQAKFDVESAEREKELFRVRNVELSAALDEVRRLNDNLTKLNTEKNEVLGIVAHDLKSPLSGVRMVASLLKEHYKRMPEVELETQLETIVDSTERMLSISSNLLKAQHIESGNAYGGAARVDVSAVVGGLVESYRATAASKGITIAFECEQSVELVCSEEALRQSVENLLSNAVKFTVHNGRVQVRLKRTVKSAVVEVQDEGPGISKSDKRKLYGKYARLSARPTGGESTTGLGLWIAKRAVESLRGTIRCISGESGTIFKIEVPMATIN